MQKDKGLDFPMMIIGKNWSFSPTMRNMVSEDENSDISDPDSYSYMK